MIRILKRYDIFKGGRGSGNFGHGGRAGRQGGSGQGGEGGGGLRGGGREFTMPPSDKKDVGEFGISVTHTEGFTEEDVHTMKSSYLQGQDIGVQKNLRGNYTYDPNDPYSVDYGNSYLTEKAGKVSAVINKSVVTKDVVAFRGVDSKVGSLKVGGTFQDKGFTSVSFNASYATKFVREPSDYSGPAMTGRLMEVHIPKGTKALYERSVHKKDIEWELVIQKGAVFKKVGETTYKEVGSRLGKPIKKLTRPVDIVELVSFSK